MLKIQKEMSALCLCILMLILELQAVMPMNQTIEATGSMTMTDEDRLLEELFKRRHYNPVSRPALRTNDTVNVWMSFLPKQIVDIDELNEVMYIHLWIQLRWNDFRLAWNPNDFGGIRRISIPHSSVWTPDVVLLNSADKWKQWSRVNVLVSSDGISIWYPPMIMISYCSIDIAWFPFDEQTCSLQFESWSYSVEYLNLTLWDSGVSLKHYQSNSEWDLTEIYAEYRQILYEYVGYFSDVHLILHLRRQALFYAFNLMMPCSVLSAISASTFILPIQSGERIGLGISTLLALTVNQLIVADKVPPTSDAIPLIGVYCASVSIMNVVSLIAMTVISNLYFRSPAVHTMPKWMKTLICHRLAKIVRLERSCGKKGVDPVNDKCEMKYTDQSRNDGLVNNAMHLLVEPPCSLLHPSSEKNDADNQNVKENDVNNDWQYAALVIDRLCFFICVFYVAALALIFYGCALVLRWK